jgi:hypothetical protein
LPNGARALSRRRPDRLSLCLPKVVDSPPPTSGNAIDQAPRLRSNTNLEKVSDWLSTVIRGIALTQLFRVPGYVSRFSEFLAKNFGNTGHLTGSNASNPVPTGMLVATAQ